MDPKPISTQPPSDQPLLTPLAPTSVPSLQGGPSPFTQLDEPRTRPSALWLLIPLFITAVIGEGGSGGALAVGLADRVLMLENSVYSVISPEGCAAILWKDASQRERAAEALKITAQDLLNLGVIDEIVPEPPGGAHSDPEAAAAALGDALQRHLGQLRKLKTDKLLKRREEKYLSMGALTEK